MTVCLRDEEGEILLRRQVRTRWKKTSEFFAQLGEDARKQGGGFVVILEICGFHHWLVELLGKDAESGEVIVIQPQQRSKRKTDRRDANALSELLRVNHHRLLAKQRVQGVRWGSLPTADEEQDRQLTRHHGSSVECMQSQWKTNREKTLLAAPDRSCAGRARFGN